MPRYKRPSIEELGGIKSYLDATTAQHRGFGYKEFILFSDLRLPKTIIGKIFKVSSDTVRDWQARNKV